MKIIIYTFSLLFLIASCQHKGGGNRVDTLSENKGYVFDSIYYHLLTDAYKAKDTAQLRSFFDAWYDYSLKIDKGTEDPIEKMIGEIFTVAYHPLEYEKYGWMAGPGLLSGRYVIPQSSIKYVIADVDDISDELWEPDWNVIEPFYPRPALEGVKYLYDVDPFKKSMELFLESNNYEKLSFLREEIDTPISRGCNKYQTSPEIRNIIINKNMDSAAVTMRLVSTGLRVEVIRRDGKWQMESVEQLWIE